MLGEFREFAIKGNVVDVAVGIMIGGAFGTVIKSLVEDVLMPPIGLATRAAPTVLRSWTRLRRRDDAVDGRHVPTTSSTREVEAPRPAPNRA